MIRKVNNLVNRLARISYRKVGADGLLHIVYSSVLAALLQTVLSLLDAVAIVIALGLVKGLVWDYLLKQGQASLKDMLCNLVGVAIVVISNLF